jgi:hypothetical protein
MAEFYRRIPENEGANFKRESLQEYQLLERLQRKLLRGSNLTLVEVCRFLKLKAKRVTPDDYLLTLEQLTRLPEALAKSDGGNHYPLINWLHERVQFAGTDAEQKIYSRCYHIIIIESQKVGLAKTPSAGTTIP